MKTKCVTFIMIVVVCFLFYSQYESRKFFHTVKTTENVSEHIDIDIGQMHYNIIHYVTNSEGSLLLSEVISGYYFKNIISGSYYLQPLKSNIIFSDSKYSPSLSKLGSVSICLYKEIGDNTVIFFEQDRGMLFLDKKIIHLPSLFLAKNVQKKCDIFNYNKSI